MGCIESYKTGHLFSLEVDYSKYFSLMEDKRRIFPSRDYLIKKNFPYHAYFLFLISYFLDLFLNVLPHMALKSKG